MAKIPATISRPTPTIEIPWSVNNLYGGSVSYTAMKCIALFLNRVLHGQSVQYVHVYNFTNIHAMSHRSDFCPCSSRVNIYEPAICCTIDLLSAVTQVVLPSFHFPTAMSVSQSVNTWMLEVMSSSKNEGVFIRDLSDVTIQIVIDT